MNSPIVHWAVHVVVIPVSRKAGSGIPSSPTRINTLSADSFSALFNRLRSASFSSTIQPSLPCGPRP